MKINITLEIDDDARRGLSGSRKLASRDEVRAEIQAVWAAHLDDLRDMPSPEGT